MARNKETPVTFQLPDDDEVNLITWEFVVSKAEKILNGVLSNLELINADLTRIDNKILTWIDEND